MPVKVRLVLLDPLELTHDKVKVAVIIVFTKYDILFNECYRKATRSPGKPAKCDAIRMAETNAGIHLNKLIEDSQIPVESVGVSSKMPQLSETLLSLSYETEEVFVLECSKS